MDKKDKFYTGKELWYGCKMIGIGILLSAFAAVFLTIVNLGSNGETIDRAFSGDAWMPFYILVLAPVLEEFLFRMFFFKVLLRKILGIDYLYAAGIVSVVFGLLHYPIPTIFLASLLSMILCNVYERTGTISASICLHFGFNLFSFCLQMVGI